MVACAHSTSTERWRSCASTVDVLFVLFFLACAWRGFVEVANVISVEIERMFAMSPVIH